MRPCLALCGHAAGDDPRVHLGQTVDDRVRASSSRRAGSCRRRRRRSPRATWRVRRRARRAGRVRLPACPALALMKAPARSRSGSHLAQSVQPVSRSPPGSPRPPRARASAKSTGPPTPTRNRRCALRRGLVASRPSCPPLRLMCCGGAGAPAPGPGRRSRCSSSRGARRRQRRAALREAERRPGHLVSTPSSSTQIGTKNSRARSCGFVGEIGHRADGRAGHLERLHAVRTSRPL